MFYAHFVLSKKGPLARIWLAAHWDKKLTKAHVFETNIESSVEGILQPKVKMALRTSGHLLLGVVRIYSRKAKYLLADCNEAFIKIKMAFRPGVVDLPEENREAAVATITLPEVFHDFDSTMPDLNDIDVSTQFTLNQSRADEITMREDYGNITLIGDDGFGDMGFEESEEIGRDVSTVDDALDQVFGGKKDKRDGSNETSVSITASSAGNQTLDKHIDIGINAPLTDDGFGGDVGEGIFAAENDGLFERGGLFDDAPMEQARQDASTTDRLPTNDRNEKKSAAESDDDDYFDNGPASMGGGSSGPSSPPASPQPPLENGATSMVDKADDAGPPDQTVLIQNEEETFALAPLDAATTQGIEKNKAKRKRKLIVDEVKNISGEEMKSQLSDTSDIVTTLDLAPPTKRLMHWKETGGVEKLFALPGRPIPSRILSKLYQRHLTTRAVENEDFGMMPEEPAESQEFEMAEKEKEDELPQIPQPPIQQTPPPIPPPTTLPIHRMEPVIPPSPVVNNKTTTPRSRKRRHEPEVTPHRSMIPIDHSLVNPYDNQLQYPMHMPAPQLPNMTDSHQLTNDLSLLHPELPRMMSNMPPPALPPMLSPTSTVQSSPVNQTPCMPSNMPTEQQFVVPIEQLPQEQPETEAQQSILQTHEIVNDTPVPEDNSQMFDKEETFQQPADNFLRPQPTPYNMQEEEDEMECPASVGPADEQGADETYEQFEERVLNKRAQQMLHVVKSRLDRSPEVSFAELVRANNRKQVAQKFYTFLVLKKQQAVELTQERAFGDILITAGPKLETIY